MEFLAELPNAEFVYSGSVESLLTQLKSGLSNAMSVVTSGMWFDYESPDYSHFDAYDAAFDKIGAAVSQSLGETANRQLGFDEETFEPVALLMQHEIYADAFYHWPASNLILFSTHEDKELPIEIVLLRLP